jgi:hypothetical protein
MGFCSSRQEIGVQTLAFGVAEVPNDESWSKWQ